MDKDKLSYEIGFLVIPTLSEEEVAAAVAAVRATVEEVGGTVTKEEAPKFKRLTYEMRKKIDTKYETYDSAYFAYVIFDADAPAIATLNEKVTAMVPVLRHLIVKDPTLDRLVDADVEEEEEEDEKPVAPVAEVAEVSEEELDKSIDKIVGDEAEAEVKEA